MVNSHHGILFGHARNTSFPLSLSFLALHSFHDVCVSVAPTTNPQASISCYAQASIYCYAQASIYCYAQASISCYAQAWNPNQ